MSYEYSEVLDKVVARSREWVEVASLTDDEAADVILLCDLAEDMRYKLEVMYAHAEANGEIIDRLRQSPGPLNLENIPVYQGTNPTQYEGISSVHSALGWDDDAGHRRVAIALTDLRRLVNAAKAT